MQIQINGMKAERGEAHRMQTRSIQTDRLQMYSPDRRDAERENPERQDADRESRQTGLAGLTKNKRLPEA